MILPKSSLSYLYDLDFNRSLYLSTVNEMVAKRDYASLLEVIKFMESGDLDDRYRRETVYSLTNALLPSLHEEHYGPDSQDRAPHRTLAWSKSAEDFFGRMLAIAKKDPASFVGPVCSILDAALKFQVDHLISPALAVLKKQQVERAGVMLIGAWANEASMRYVEAMDAKGKLTADLRLQLIEGHISRRMHKTWGRGENAQFLDRCFVPDIERRIIGHDEEMPYMLDEALRRGCAPFFESYPGLVRQQAPAIDFLSGRRRTVLTTLNNNFLTSQLTFDEWKGALKSLTSPLVNLDVNEEVDGVSPLLQIASADISSMQNPKDLTEDQIRLAIVELLESGADAHRKIAPAANDVAGESASALEKITQRFPERAQIMRTWVVKEQIKRVANGARPGPHG